MEIDKVCEKAEAIAKTYNPGNVSPFPFDRIQASVGDLYIALTDKIPDNISGAIAFDKNDKKFTILINKDKPATRQHFTIAHELGHYFLHQDQVKEKELLIDRGEFLDAGNALLRDDNATSTQLEIEANNFAASLIMPKEFIVQAWNSIHNVELCAKIFNVSVSAMSIRLERLKLLNS